MDKKIKKTIAREGLILIVLAISSHVFYNLELNQIAKQPISPNFHLRHPFIALYFIYLIIRFAIWAIKVLQQK
jgi:hypothetical protein